MKTNFNKCIFSIQQDKENNKKEEQPREFIVEIDDPGTDYLESLLNIIEKYNKRGIDIRKANSIEYGDFLVFTKNDIRLRKNNLFCNKVLSLVGDYYKIENLIKKLYKDDRNLPSEACNNCPYYKSAKKRNFTKEILIDGDFIDVDEKISVFNNFIKIGYDTYDIYDHKGKDIVDIDGTIYEVTTTDFVVKPPKKESFCSKIKKNLCLKLCKCR